MSRKRYFNVEAWCTDTRDWLVAGWSGYSRKAVLREVRAAYPHARRIKITLARSGRLW